MGVSKQVFGEDSVQVGSDSPLSQVVTGRFYRVITNTHRTDGAVATFAMEPVGPVVLCRDESCAFRDERFSSTGLRSTDFASKLYCRAEGATNSLNCGSNSSITSASASRTARNSGANRLAKLPDGLTPNGFSSAGELGGATLTNGAHFVDGAGNAYFPVGGTNENTIYGIANQQNYAALREKYPNSADWCPG